MSSAQIIMVLFYLGPYIIQFNELYSVMEFFLTSVKPQLDNDCNLESACLGQEMLHVDTDLPLITITPS